MIYYLIIFLLILLILYKLFLRKPNRINNISNTIVSPCDGLVTSVDGNNISVFLSVFDVHWQYAPVDSKVKSIDTIHGGHKMAMEPESIHNEGVRVVFGSQFGDIIVTQRVGFFVRRIQNIINIGDTVKQSEPYGVIRFGSRVDIILPNTVRSILKKGQRVIGGETPMI
jgi:phosphatidylserine decarboxylase